MRGKTGVQCCRRGIYANRVSHALADSAADVPIDILLGTHGLRYGALPVSTDVVTEGELNQNTADALIVIQLLDDLDDLVDFGLGGDRDVLERDSDLLRRLRLHADIDGGVRTCTRLYNGELRLEARVLSLQSTDARGDLIANRPAARDRVVSTLKLRCILRPERLTLRRQCRR